MASDLTILYYSANRISEQFGEMVRKELAISSGGKYPVMAVTFKPVKFPIFYNNFIMGDREPTTWLLYHQILTAAMLTRTRYVACAEDDTLYAPRHFDFRPSDDSKFYYSLTRWFIEEDGEFRYRPRSGMGMCICNRELLIDTLETRFRKFPVPLSRSEAVGWAEPGRYEHYLKLPRVGIEWFISEVASVTFNHKPSLGGRRKAGPDDVIREELPYWGKAAELWQRIHG